MRRSFALWMVAMVSLGPIWAVSAEGDAVGDAFVAYLCGDCEGALSKVRSALDASPDDPTLLRMKSLLLIDCQEEGEDPGPEGKSPLEEEMELLLEQHAEVMQILEKAKKKLKENQGSNDESYERLAVQEQAIRLANERILLLEKALNEAQAQARDAPSREELGELRTALSEAEARGRELEEELKTARETPSKGKEAAEKTIQELRDRMGELQQEKESLSRSLEEAKKDMRKRRESSVGELDLDRLTAPLKEELAKARSENRVLKEELEKALKRAIRAETDAVRAEAKVNVLESKLEEARSSGPGTGSGSSEKAMEREMRSLQKELGKERKAREDADHLVQSLRQEIQRLTAQIVTGEGLSMETLQERIEAEEYDRARREALWLFGQNPRDDELRRLIIRLTDVLSAVQ